MLHQDKCQLPSRDTWSKGAFVLDAPEFLLQVGSAAGVPDAPPGHSVNTWTVFNTLCLEQSF